MDLSTTPVVFGLAAVATTTWLLSRLMGRTRRPLPPGPSRKPLIGNFFDVPGGKNWETYASWADTYGDIMSLTVFGQTIIVLNSLQDVRELFVARAANYSERIRMTMVELAGWRDSSPIVPPGDTFRAMRRFMTQVLGPEAIRDCIPVQELEIEAYLRRLLEVAEADLQKQTNRLTGSVILRLVYRYEVTSDDDFFVHQSEAVFKSFHMVTSPGWIVDTFPVLRHLPSWLPGMGFKRKASEWRQLAECTRTDTLNWTKGQIASGNPIHCFAAKLLPDEERMKDEKMFGMVLADLYMAGLDTISTTVLKFFLLMALHPDVQLRAQREIDDVTRGERLPAYEDREALPYLQAIVKEIHRWHPAGPMGLPHCAAVDDEYKGYLIPKGAIIFANVWWGSSILHNPEKYPDPSAFLPERYLEIAAEDPETETYGINEDPTKVDFGFGARQCPGRHLAQSTLFLTAAKALSIFTISDAVDAHGTPLTHDTVECLPGAVGRVAPFNVTIKPRSVRGEAILRASARRDGLH